MNFLREAKVEGQNVLVHCKAGVNRSASTLAIWMVADGICDSITEVNRKPPYSLYHVLLCVPCVAD
jgi:protein-tyrosine phosphatase